MSLALQSFIRTIPKMWSCASEMGIGWPNVLPRPTKKALRDHKKDMYVQVCVRLLKKNSHFQTNVYSGTSEKGHVWANYFVFVERLSSFGGNFQCIEYAVVLLACPLLGGLSSFRVSLYWRFHCITISNSKSISLQGPNTGGASVAWSEDRNYHGNQS